MFEMKFKPCRSICLLAALQVFFMGSVAWATQSPLGCGFNNTILNIGTTNNFVTNGTTVFFQANIQNPPLNCGTPNASCDVTLDANGLVFTCPGANGTPSGSTTTLLPGNLTLPGCTIGFAQTNFTIGCVVNVSPGVLTAAARVASPGAVVHKNPLQDDPAQLLKEISVSLVQPCVAVGKTCVSAISTPGVGTVVTFTGSITNCSPVNPNAAAQNALLNIQVFNNQPVPGTLVLQVPVLFAGTFTNFTGRYTNTTSVCGPFNDTLTFLSTVNTDTPFTITNTASASCPVTFTPCIAVTKNCSTNLVTLCNSNAGTITFSGIVSNCGNITLTNVVLSDDLTASVVLSLGSLAPGATAPWTANFPVTAALCGRSNIVNTVTATGVNLCNAAQTVTNRASCSFSVICPSPSISITKVCASPVVTNVGSSLTVTGQVCNTGNVPFDNVIVVDAQPGTPTSATNNIGTLAAGQCKPYSFTYTATTCDPNRDTVTAIGTASSCPGAPSTATASATCFLCCPGISIQKLVACLLPGAVCPGSTSDYGTSATGVKGNTGDPTQDNPAFCYIIIVRNTGHDPLTNIVIRDDKLGAIGTFPGPLAVGGTITISNLRTNWATTTTNTATVTAQCGPSATSPGNGATVSAATNAVAIVVPANIVCVKLASVNGSTPTANFVATDCTSQTNVVTWYAAVTNNGQATLCNIVIRELGTGPDLLPCGAVNIPLTNCLAPGQGTGLIPLCTTTYGCVDTNIDNSIRVIGTATGGSNVCAINILGSNIVAESECRASVTLCCTPPTLGCRVTGGGRQDDPEVCPANVRYVTHGGQVGAPVGNSNCVVTIDNIIGNPCIHGRWTHVRHQQGGLEGNFHARFYDTLECACLAAFPNSAGLFADGISEDGRCNPGDKIAGPEPRKSPANKIVFTGVGDWADPNGRREPRSVLFRVDIEDRSEPGGFHPGGAKDPADRYRIRIWVLSDSELARLNNPSDGLLDFRNCIAACHGLKYQDGVLASDIDNSCGGAGTLTFPGGCPVRQPDIDDGGALKNGNHQIHPQIKACP